jgi:very-short-patch-repair endonuclease
MSEKHTNYFTENNSIIDTKKEYMNACDYLFSNNVKCRICGEHIFYENQTKLIFNHKLSQYEKIGKTDILSKKLLGEDVFITCCESCLLKKYPDYENKNKKRIFQTWNYLTEYIYNADKSKVESHRKKNNSVTYDNMVIKYGKELGEKKWEQYRQRQSETNTFEYKKTKYDMSEQEFRQYNQSRAVTLDNMIKRYGCILGHEKWNKYVERQKYTKSKEYYTEELKDSPKYFDICKRKANTLSNFIKRAGNAEKGTEKWVKYITSMNNKKAISISKISQLFFKELETAINKTMNDIVFDSYYAQKNEEKMFLKNEVVYFVDYYLPRLNLILEFKGDFWHANPKLFKEDYKFKWGHGPITAKEIWQRDQEREQFLKENFHTEILEVWEYDYVNNPASTLNNIKKQIIRIAKGFKNEENTRKIYQFSF